MSRRVTPLLAAAIALASAVPAHAAPVQQFLPNQNAVGTVAVTLPATIRKLNDLDFGFITVTAAGTAVLDSNTGAVTTTGGVLFAGGLPHAAEFEAVSPTKNVVRIGLPKKASILTRVGGTETMSIDNWTINGTTTRNVTARETFGFKVGATLQVGANQAEGTYTGTFDVTINYN